MPSVLPEREQLYEQVWTTPMVHLARRFGLAGPALRKVCVGLGIPVPERGHWAKLAAGHIIPKPVLPPQSAEVPPQALARQRAPRLPKLQRSLRDAGVSAAEALQKPIADQAIEPAYDMSTSAFHALVRPLLPIYLKEAKEARQRETKHEWEQAHPGRPYRGEAPPYYTWMHFCDRGQILAPTHKKSAIRVSLVSYQRALHFVNSLVTKLEKVGYEVAFGERQERLLATRSAVHVSIRVTEKLDAGTRFDRINSATKEREYAKTLTPTGRLTLGIEQMGLGETVLSDTSSTTLEERWGDILKAVEYRFQASLDDVARWKQYEDERREAERTRAEQEQLRKEALRRTEEEKARREALIREAKDWESAELLRRYVAHVATLRHSASSDDAFDAWKAWALIVANALDRSPNRSAASVGHDELPPS